MKNTLFDASPETLLGNPKVNFRSKTLNLESCSWGKPTKYVKRFKILDQKRITSHY